MKKFRLITAMLLISSLLLTFSLVAFAGGSVANLSFDTKLEYDNEDTITVNVKLDAAAEIDMYGYITLSYDEEVFSVSETDCTTSSTSGSFDLSTEGRVLFMIDATETYAANDVVFSVKFTVKDKNSVVGKQFSFIPDDTGFVTTDSYDTGKTASLTITKKTATVVNANTNTTLAGYTDVVNFESSLTGVTATSPKLAFDLYEGTTKHKSYEVSLGDGVSLEGGTLSFKIAVVGAPTGTTITLQNPAVK